MQDRQIDRMINELIKRGENSKDKALFIRHYDAYSIDAEFAREIVEKAGLSFFAHKYSLHDIQSAFDPFLEWTKEMWKQSGEESALEFLKKCNVYPLHYGIFQSYFETGRCKRHEDVLYHEIEYER